MPQPLPDHIYYQARHERELALARTAPHPEAARAHATLAALYVDRLGAIAEPALPGVVQA